MALQVHEESGSLSRMIEDQIGVTWQGDGGNATTVQSGKAIEMKRMTIRGSLLGLSALILVVPGPTGADRPTTAISRPTLNRGVQLQSPPRVVPVRGTRVYHAPTAPENYFVYRYSHYLFSQGTWMSAPQHDGPWTVIPMERVPGAILAVPVNYYKNPPAHWKKRGAPPWAEARTQQKDRRQAAKQRDQESDG